MCVIKGLRLSIVLWLVCGALCQCASDPVPAQLAKRAAKARDSGQTVRAYLLFAEAAARDPHNATYRANRDALAPAAKLLTQAKIQTADITSEVASAQSEAAHSEPPIERISSGSSDLLAPLAPLPHVQADPAKHDFDLRADTKSLVVQVAAAFGVEALADKDIEPGKQVHFELQGADFRTALEALTAATHTFVFPVGEKLIYFAPDTETKRNELEPLALQTFSLQEALTERDLIDAANAVRGLLSLRSIGWNGLNRTVVIRDRVTRARLARSLMEALLLPHAQVSIEVQFLTLDTDRKFQYGATLQTAFQLMNFGHLSGGLKNVLPAATGSTQFLAFGGGASLFGVAVADASAFASYSNSVAQSIYEATVVVADRQTASLHVGDKYPIASSIYTGSQQGAGSIYNPAPQITLEDLGLNLKIVPHVNGSGDIALDVEADYRSLGSQTFNTVPSIAERAFKGVVNLREGEWAILAGLDSSSKSISRSGLAGVAQIPGLGQLLASNTRETQTSNTLLVIKPTITRLPVSDYISPQFLLGARRGERVLI